MEQSLAVRSADGVLDYRATFGRAAHLLAAASDFREALQQTLAACLPVLGDFGFFDAREGDGALRVVRAHGDERVAAILRSTRWVRQERSDMNLCALSTGRAALHSNIDEAWYLRVAVNEGHLALLRDLAFGSMITVPIHYGGELIGALTLFMGTSRRQHGPAHLELAADIAAMAAPVVANARLLESHGRVAEALRISEERLQLAQQAAGLGAWDWNVVTNEVYWSPKYRDIYGLPPDQPPSFRAGMAVLSHEDREQVAQAMASALQAKTEYRSLQRIRHPLRGQRWVEAIGKAAYDERGLPVRVAGIVADVTERHRAGEEMRSLRDAVAAELDALRRLHAITLSTARPGEQPDALLRDILVAGLEITGRDRGAIHLFDPAAGALRLAVAQGFEPEFCERIRIVALAEKLPSALALRQRERVVLEDIAVDLKGSPHLPALLAAGVRAAQSTPLISRGGELIGTFTTHWRTRGRPTERELRMLDMLSRAAADLVEWGRGR